MTKSQNIPLAEFTSFPTVYPHLVPYDTGDFHSNRPHTCSSMADWVNLSYGLMTEYLLGISILYSFIVHNISSGKQVVIENSYFICKIETGWQLLDLRELKVKLQNDDR